MANQAAKDLGNGADIKDIINKSPTEKEYYNNIPVYGCNNCRSLLIINCETELNKDITCYCGMCYSADIKHGHISEGQELIKHKNL